MIRYTLLRFLVFFGCLALFWLLGLRDTNELPWLAVAAAIASMVISAFVLRPFREDMIRQIEARREARAQRRETRTDTDEAVEDRARDAAQTSARERQTPADDEEETYR